MPRTVVVNLELAPTVCNGLGEWDNANVQKKMLGMTTLLVMLIILHIVLTAFLSIWFSGKSKARVRNEQRSGRRQRGDEPNQLDCLIWGRLGLDVKKVVELRWQLLEQTLK